MITCKEGDKSSSSSILAHGSYQITIKCPKNPNKTSFCLNETAPDEVIKIINQLDGKKSSDIYNISPDIVKLSGQATAQCLSIIFNQCIKEGQFPNALKKAKVIRTHLYTPDFYNVTYFI